MAMPTAHVGYVKCWFGLLAMPTAHVGCCHSHPHRVARRAAPPAAAGRRRWSGRRKIFFLAFFPALVAGKAAGRKPPPVARSGPPSSTGFVGFRRFSSVLVRLVCFFSLSWGTLVATVTFFSRAWRNSLACAFENPFRSAARAFGLSARLEWELGPGVGATVVACEWF